MHKSILIVEDEAIVAQDLAGKLRRLGYDIAGVLAEGEAAVALVGRAKPDLVLMDIRLEGSMDGVDAAKVIQSRYDVPVIYLTAHSDPATLARAKLTGPFGYILKPFEARDLATQIELALYKHQAERQLREQREWLRVTLTSIGDAVIAADNEGRINFINPVAETLTGWTADEAIGRPISIVFRIVNEQTGQAAEDPVARVLKDRCVISLANHTALVARDGRMIPIEDSAAPIFDAGGKIIGAVLVFHDVTDQRRTQDALYASEARYRRLNETLEQQVAERTAIASLRTKQLQALTVALIESEETERNRISQLLHDDLQQMLASANMQLQAVVDSHPADPMLTNVAEILRCSIAKARSLSHELSSPVLKHSGLSAGLKWLSNMMEERFNLRVMVEVNGPESIEYESLKIFIFRAAQELLFNIVKHADVDTAHVALSNANGDLVLEVMDQGRGFEAGGLDGGAPEKTGLGLRSLKERTSYMGGSLTIDSGLGRGSRVTLKIPLYSDASPGL